MLRKIAILFICILSLITFFPIASSAQSSTELWSKPRRLSTEYTFSWFPDIAVDAIGRVHVVWSSGAPGFDTVSYTFSEDGINWMEPNNIAAIAQGYGSYATRPALFIGKSGMMYLIYRATTMYYSKAYVEVAYSARNWLPGIAINTDQIAYFSKIVEDSQGKLHLVYSENVPSTNCPICFRLYYRQSNDGGMTWSSPLAISEEGNGSAKPQLIEDNKGNLYLVWEAGRGGDLGQVTGSIQINFSYLRPGAAKWSSPIQLNWANSPGLYPTIGIDGRQKIIVAWLDQVNNIVIYRTSNDQGEKWSLPSVIPGVVGGLGVVATNLDDYSMATDNLGNVHLIMVGREQEIELGTQAATETPGGTGVPTKTPEPTNTPEPAISRKKLSLLHLIWNGIGWSKPISIVDYFGDLPEWPRLAIGLGNQLHVVWFVRDEENIFKSDTGRYEIWYSKRLNVPEALRKIPYPTVTPEIVFSSSTPILQTESEMEDSEEVYLHPVTTVKVVQPDNLVYKETDYLRVVFYTLIPVIVMVVVLVVIVLKVIPGITRRIE